MTTCHQFDCPCGVDHWSHLAAGFQGIAKMMDQLEAAGVLCHQNAVHKLEFELARLKAQIDRQKQKLNGAM